LRYLERPNEAHLQNAAQADLAGCDCRRQRKNLHYWYRLMQKARLAAPITDAQIRLAQRELDPDAICITYSSAVSAGRRRALAALISRLLMNIIKDADSIYITGA
jgi:phenylpyruvate tautomerase PptA (4-oxalocrotonate tautomerase family)